MTRASCLLLFLYMCEETKKEKVSWIIPAVIILLVVGSCWATWYFLVDVNTRGTFGDMFGVTNAFFSGLAFGGVIYAIILQRRELQLQREELKDTREVLTGQKQQLEAQNTTLKKQNFENTFFQLLRLHNEIASSVEFVKSSYNVKGRKSFFRLYDDYTNYYRQLGEDGLDNMDRINSSYLEFNGRWQSETGHYFRNLYAIVKFIENSKVGDIELYINLIRVQLTDNELLLLFYHSLSDTDGQRLIPLIEKYALLKSLPKDRLLNRQAHESLYKDSAYRDVWTVT